MSSLSEWLSHIECIHHRSIDMTLERVCAVRERLALHLQPACAVISVAGTNGKGSSVAMLDSIYRAAGYRVAKYTSPHLVRYNERIVINGVEISDEALCTAFTVVEQARGDIPLTYFEFGTLAALHLFAEAKLDVAVLEVGLGGRLDAVNALDADAALITSIGIDHVAWLGRDRESIALEKAGIMRTACPVISADPSPPMALANHAKAIGARLWQNGRDFTCVECGRDDAGSKWTLRFNKKITAVYNKGDDDDRANKNMHNENKNAHNTRAKINNNAISCLCDLPRPQLMGAPQLQNAAGVVALVQIMQQRLTVSEDALRNGLRAAWLPGRLQCIAGAPKVILDVAHNADAVTVLSQHLHAHRRNKNGRVCAVFASLTDKDLQQVLGLMMPVVDGWYVAGLDTPRGRSTEDMHAEMARWISDARVRGDVPSDDANILLRAFNTPMLAFEAACAEAAAEDCIVVFGSFITVGDIIRHCKDHRMPLQNERTLT